MARVRGSRPLPSTSRAVVGADTSCLMQLRTRAEHEGNPIVTRHIAEVLAAALP